MTQGCPPIIFGGGERATPAETNEQEQERLRKRRETGADALLRLPMEEMGTHQRERLAAETAADKDARLQLQMSARPSHKPG